MDAITRVLLVEDNPGDARLLREMFIEHRGGDAALSVVTCLGEAESHLAAHDVDVILLDLGLPDARSLGAIRRIHAAAPAVPIVVLTGWDDESIAAQALQEGAQDYLIKGQIETRGLFRALRYAIARKALEEALFLEKERAEVTLNSIGEGVASTDLAGRVTFLNAIAERMTGWSRQEASGRPLGELMQLMDASTRELIPGAMEIGRGRNQLARVPADCVLIGRGGGETSIDGSFSTIYDRGGQATGAVLVFRDVGAARALALKMAHAAQHDALTGLPNRMLFSDRVGRAIAMARRHGTKAAVLFLDLDGFKRINDSLGHQVGDELLRSVAARLVDCVRGSDTVSRQGGDEFVVLLSEVSQAGDAAAMAKRMVHALSRSHTVGQHQLFATGSIGVSLFPTDGADAATLIRHADAAMYQAKSDPQQRYHLFTAPAAMAGGTPAVP